MKPLLQTTEYGDPGGVPLLIVHGLFGSARNWRAIAKQLARTRRVLAVDMRNHGASFWDDNHSYADMAGDLAAVIANYGGLADVLGHSMGGKAAMVLALTQPALVHRLIVADIAPIYYDHSQISNVAVMRGLPLDQVTRRSEADQLLAQHIADPGVRAFLLQSLEFSDAGNRWLLNLDALALNMDAIMGFPRLSARFDGPAAFIFGGASDYVLLAHHGEIRRLFPAAAFQGIDGAGHWLHAEKPHEFLTNVDAVLTG